MVFVLRISLVKVDKCVTALWVVMGNMVCFQKFISTFSTLFLHFACRHCINQIHIASNVQPTLSVSFRDQSK